MKNFFITLVLCLSTISAFSQISITTSGTTRSYDQSVFYKGMYGKICKIDTCYCICVNDMRSNEVLYVNLGNTPDDAITSLTAINNAFKNLKNKEYILFNDGIQDIVLYKWASAPYFSNGTPEYILNYLKNTTIQVMFGGNGQSRRMRENDKIIGCMDSPHSFQKAINNIH